MHRTQKVKEEFVKELFNDRKLFELEVLEVSSEADRIEIMQIISKNLVRDKLKKEINFSHLYTFNHFKLNSITKAIFNQIANEWLSFATEVLFYSKDSALIEIRDKQRVNFIYSISNDYFNKYKKYIFENIADTFIELVSTLPHAESHNELVSDVLKSDLISNNYILAIQSFKQLWTKVRTANNFKNADVSKLQILIAELTIKLTNKELDEVLREKLLISLRKYNLELSKLSQLSLDKFDSTLKRLKETMVNSMLKMSS